MKIAIWRNVSAATCKTKPQRRASTDQHEYRSCRPESNGFSQMAATEAHLSLL
jgi:hypothetical protein